MDANTLSKYLNAFGKLHQNRGIAPHKPILLLAILDEIGRGHVTDNQIVLTVELVAAFREYWQALPLPPGSWLERVYLPYRYLIQDGFWELVKDGHSLAGKEAGEPTSVSDARARITYARFAPDLWLLLENTAAREALRGFLLQKYFSITPQQVQPFVPADPLAAQLEKLIGEAQSKPKPKQPKIAKDGDVEYLRHSLFPKIIYAVYDHSCAVCRLQVRIDNSRVLAAAHIRPFAQFHDDHPSNGLSLCLNHHWAFDRGGFSVSDNYTILVSVHLTGSPQFLTAGAEIQLPASKVCHPDPAALAWHRKVHNFPE